MLPVDSVRCASVGPARVASRLSRFRCGTYSELILIEATDVCGQIAIQNKLPAPDGTRQRLEQLNLVVAGQQYMLTISSVARKKNNGQIPAWVEEVRKTAEGSDAFACLELRKKS